MSGCDEVVLRVLQDVQHAAWRQVEEQEETNRLLRLLCGARAEGDGVPAGDGKTKGE